MNSASAMPRIAASLLAALTLSCSQPQPAPLPSVPGRFLSHLAAICGKSFVGRIVANEPANPDDPFADKALIMHVGDCSDERVAIPFHVCDDHSRTWLITQTPTGLRLEA